MVDVAVVSYHMREKIVTAERILKETSRLATSNLCNSGIDGITSAVMIFIWNRLQEQAAKL